ncbi:GspH/FimT family pseudopilin [Lysobacter enzymogenes]|uniref:GspH/FimT family pseudopilin n=1 Tax=Lysobacter enzymogenes TaxID=69 RepID=UPI00384B5A83
MRQQGSRGFTLLELLITISVAAVLLSLALPNFRQALRSNRVSTSTNEYLGALTLARTEARVTLFGGNVCASKDGSKCEGSWSDGVMVWSNTNRNETAESDEIRRFVRGGPNLQVAVTSRNAATSFQFDQRGRIKDGAQRTFAIQPVDCPAGADLRREIVVAPTGMIRMERKSCQ